MSSEARLDLVVTANTANSKWIGFTHSGYYYLDGAAGAITTNNNTGNYWTAVFEKAIPYFALAEILELRVNFIAAPIKVSGTLSAYKPVQHCMIPHDSRD